MVEKRLPKPKPKPNQGQEAAVSNQELAKTGLVSSDSTSATHVATSIPVSDQKSIMIGSVSDPTSAAPATASVSPALNPEYVTTESVSAVPAPTSNAGEIEIIIPADVLSNDRWYPFKYDDTIGIMAYVSAGGIYSISGIRKA